MVVATIEGVVSGDVYKVMYKDDIINGEEVTIPCRKFLVTSVDVYTPLDAQKELEKELVGHVIDVSPNPHSLRADEKETLMTGENKRLTLRGGWLPDIGSIELYDEKASYSYFTVHGVER